MSPGPARSHAAALLALLSAAPGVTAHDGAVPDGAAPPYVVLRTSSGPRTRTGLRAVSDLVTVDAWCHSVGETREQAQWLADRVADALVDEVPAVTGRTCWPIEHLASQPVARDDDTRPPLMHAVDVFRLRSVPS